MNNCIFTHIFMYSYVYTGRHPAMFTGLIESFATHDFHAPAQSMPALLGSRMNPGRPPTTIFPLPERVVRAPPILAIAVG